MTSVVLDSSALVALAIPDDSLHSRALAISHRLKAAGIPILIASEVIAETLNVLGKMHGRTFAVRFGSHLLADPDIHLLAISSDTAHAALSKWEKQPGGVSYTDNLVMAAADETEEKAGERPAIFGFDAVFAKNGYRLPEEGKEAA